MSQGVDVIIYRIIINLQCFISLDSNIFESSNNLIDFICQIVIFLIIFVIFFKKGIQCCQYNPSIFLARTPNLYIASVNLFVIDIDVFLKIF